MFLKQGQVDNQRTGSGPNKSGESYATITTISSFFSFFKASSGTAASPARKATHLDNLDADLLVEVGHLVLDGIQGFAGV